MPTMMEHAAAVEDARKAHVDTLPPAVGKPLPLILRGDADP
jgi:hypothetical protein